MTADEWGCLAFTVCMALLFLPGLLDLLDRSGS